MELNELKEIISQNDVVLIKLGAEWCGPCKAMAPVIEEIGKEYDGRVKVFDIDVDESPDISSEYRVRNIPTVLFFKNGELKDKSVGGVGKSTIVDKLEALL